MNRIEYSVLKEKIERVWMVLRRDFDTQSIKKDALDAQATKKFGRTSKPPSQFFLTPNPFRP
jgi:hypothetical protein